MLLLERDANLSELTALLRSAAAGEGRIVFVGGEAGGGKTALVQSFARAVGDDARVAIGVCDSMSTPRPLAPLLDVADRIEQLRALPPDAPRDSSFQALLVGFARHELPTLLVFEDVHWADEATLDLIRFLGRRIGSARALLVITYRDDEVGSRHPLRVVMGDLATTNTVRRMSLRPLSVDAVRQLAGDRAPEAVGLHELTGGNPFFLTEVLAAGREQLPLTVRDAVLARVARLDPASSRVLEAAAVTGARAEEWVLARVCDDYPEGVEGCLQAGLLSSEGGDLVMRHELVRQSVLSVVPPHRLRAINRAVLRALEESASSVSARLAHHAEAAADTPAVMRYALAAARAAEGLGANREAAAQYARVLRFSASLEASERARLFEARARACARSEQIAEAIEAYRAALAIWRELGYRRSEAGMLVALSWIHCGMRQESEHYAAEALEVLGGGEPSLELAYAHGTMASLRTETSDLEEALAWGARTVALGEQLGSDDVRWYGLRSIYAAQLDMSGNQDERRAELEAVVAAARAAGSHSRVSTLSALIETDVQHWRLDRPARYLDEAIPYALEHGIDDWRYYIESWQAVRLMRLGQWDEASDLAARLVQQLGISVRSRIQAFIVLGRVRALRGDPEVWSALDEALTLAERASEIRQELHRLVPARIARAEAYWLADHPELAARELDAVDNLVHSKPHPWLLGEWHYWRRVLGDRQELPSGLAEPFALQIAGEHQQAAAEWDRMGCPFERARALLEGTDEAGLREALTTFERLGARTMAARATKRLRDLGVRGLPRGPRPSTRANPVGLTARELDVLLLLARGARDKQIAKDLQLSTKTVGHHVSSILAKLGQRNRSDVVSAALRLGVLPPD